MRQTTPAEVTSYAGATVSIASSITLTEIGILVGIATALLTFALNAWYMARKDRREAEEHQARMHALEAGGHE